jgi:hypothetical protein
MNIERMKEWISEHNPDALLADGFEDAIIGIGGQHGGNKVVIYDRDRCIEILADQYAKDKDCEDPYLDAIEYFSYNTECAYVGENTPIFMQGVDSEY